MRGGRLGRPIGLGIALPRTRSRGLAAHSRDGRPRARACPSLPGIRPGSLRWVRACIGRVHSELPRCRPWPAHPHGPAEFQRRRPRLEHGDPSLSGSVTLAYTPTPVPSSSHATGRSFLFPGRECLQVCPPFLLDRRSCRIMTTLPRIPGQRRERTAFQWVNGMGTIVRQRLVAVSK